MNLAISNIAWTSKEDDLVYKKMLELEFKGLEIAPSRIWNDPFSQPLSEIKRFRTEITQKGLQIIAFQAILFGHPELTIFDSLKIRTSTLKYLKKMVDLATKLGAKVLVFGSPKNRLMGNLNRIQAEEVAIDFFTKLGQYANSQGTVIGIEPNPKEYGADFLVTTEEALDFVKKVNHPGFRLHLDTGAMTINQENYEQTINKAFPYLCHLHLSEPFLAPLNNVNQKYHRIAQILVKLRYLHWISIEMKNQPEPSGLKNVFESLEMIANL